MTKPKQVTSSVIFSSVMVNWTRGCGAEPSS